MSNLNSSFIIFANASLNTVENMYFLQFISAIRPTYMAPSQYALTHSLLLGGFEQVKMIEILQIKEDHVGGWLGGYLASIPLLQCSDTLW